MESFRKTGDFFKLTHQQPLDPITIEPNVNCLYNVIFWFIVSLSPIIYFLFKMLLSKQYLYFVIFITCIGLGFRVLAKSIDNMEVKDTKLKKNNNVENGEKIKSS